jgi:flagellar assembly protein FliH
MSSLYKSDEFERTTVRHFQYPPSTVPGNKSSGHRLLDELADKPQDSSGIETLLQKARDEGRREGQCAAEKVLRSDLQQVKGAVAEAIASFSTERSRYFTQVEAEVVQLALAIARRILHRETQIDPGLLMALVRAQLQELDRTTKVAIHVNPASLESWRAAFDKDQHVELVADPATSNHACRLETEMGSTNLSLDSQLGEIENGLFDLLPKLVRSHGEILQ